MMRVRLHRSDNTVATQRRPTVNYGPAFLQGEYDKAAFHQAGEPDNTVRAHSVTAAYTLTGESRPYKACDATYGAIKPAHGYGAWEIAVRHDHAGNDGNDGVFQGVALPGVKATRPRWTRFPF